MALATTWAELCDKETGQYVNLVEIEPAKLISPASWIYEGSYLYYITDWSPVFPMGVPSQITENGTALTEVSTKAGLSTAGTWYYETSTSRVYVHCTGNADPDTKTMLVYFWLYFGTQGMNLEILSDVWRHFEALVADVPSLTDKMDDFIFSSASRSISTLALDNSQSTDYGNLGAFDSIFYDYIWEGKTVRILLGGESLPYSEYQAWSGVVVEGSLDDTKCSFTLKDSLTLLEKKIPTDTYTTADYTYLENSAEGKVIPIAIGRCLNVRATLVNTTDWTFRIARKYKTILKIRNNGVVIYTDGDVVGGGHIVNSLIPETGSFQLNYWAGGTITVDIDGETDGNGWEGNDINTYGKMFTFLATDSELGGISSSLLNTTAITAMDTDRPEEMGLYLETTQKLNDILNTLDESVMAYHTKDRDGKIAAYAWDDTMDTVNAVEFTDNEITACKLTRETKKLYRKVKIGYAKNNYIQQKTDEDTTAENWADPYKYVEDSDDTVKYKHNCDEELPVDTLLRDKTDAETVADRYLDIVSKVWLTVELKARLKPFQVSIGDTIQLDSDRFPLDSQYFKVTGIEKSTDDNRMTVKAFQLLS